MLLFSTPPSLSRGSPHPHLDLLIGYHSLTEEHHGIHRSSSGLTSPWSSQEGLPSLFVLISCSTTRAVATLFWSSSSLSSPSQQISSDPLLKASFVRSLASIRSLVTEAKGKVVGLLKLGFQALCPDSCEGSCSHGRGSGREEDYHAV